MTLLYKSILKLNPQSFNFLFKITVPSDADNLAKIVSAATGLLFLVKRLRNDLSICSRPVSINEVL